MRLIIKGKEPESLRLFRTSTPNPTYDGYINKEHVRSALISEQKGICAYCMQRINDEWDNRSNKFRTEIEHYKSQDNFPELSLDFNNMLAVCNGNQGNPQHLMHCDKSKDAEKHKKYLPLTLNPLLAHSVEQIKYRKDGFIYSDNEQINLELDKVLNLNQQTLKNNRKYAIDAAFAELDKRHGNSS
jgi:uncharacterized protein (TIGR02646 family)